MEDSVIIVPVPKLAEPTSESDYRPISITSILLRLVERRIVTSYRPIYPATQSPPPQLCFTDQFAFRPTESTLITLLHTVCTMLSANPFVRVFAIIDFSEAFDSIRHNQLLAKLSYLAIPDEIYNWVENISPVGTTALDFAMKCLPSLVYSLAAYSALGPASYAITTANLRPVHNGNAISTVY